MSSQYHENGKRKVFYQNNCIVDSQKSCPGSCTCDYGTRTEYDYMQFQHFMLGKQVQIPVMSQVPKWKS